MILLAEVLPKVKLKAGGGTGYVTNPHNPLTVYWGVADFKPVFTHPSEKDITFIGNE